MAKGPSKGGDSHQVASILTGNREQEDEDLWKFKPQPLPNPTEHQNKSRPSSYPYPHYVVLEREAKEREVLGKREHDRSEREDNERGQPLKEIESFNRAENARNRSLGEAAEREEASAHSARVAAIEQHRSEVASEQTRLDYFANRESIELDQASRDEAPAQDKNNDWDRDR